MKIDCVLDTSALCALHFGEAGADVVRNYVETGVRVMHAVNVAEFYFTVLKRRDARLAPEAALDLLRRHAIDAIPLMDDPLLALTAEVRLAVPGLSVGDGFAVALGSVADAPVVTADRAFARAGDYARIIVIR